MGGGGVVCLEVPFAYAVCRARPDLLPAWSWCRKYLRRPVVVNIGTAGKATANVTQRVVVGGPANDLFSCGEMMPEVDVFCSVGEGESCSLGGDPTSSAPGGLVLRRW